MIKRWWRWLTNTWPVALQVWDLDGVGLVEILRTQDDSTTGNLFSQWVVWARPITGDKGQRYLVDRFRRQAVLRPLTLGDLQPGSNVVALGKASER